jgi:hypothetical protein
MYDRFLPRYHSGEKGSTTVLKCRRGSGSSSRSEVDWYEFLSLSSAEDSSELESELLESGSGSPYSRGLMGWPSSSGSDVRSSGSSLSGVLWFLPCADWPRVGFLAFSVAAAFLVRAADFGAGFGSGVETWIAKSAETSSVMPW